jgi:hypothetical protein
MQSPADSPFPSAVIPSSPADISTAASAFCPSVCGLALRSVVADYATRAPTGRLCPQVHDGLWRLGLVCDTDPSPSSPSSSSCLPTYVGVHRAFEEGLGGSRSGGASPSSVLPDTPPELRALCNSTCLRRVKDSASAAAGFIGAALVDPSPPLSPSASTLLEYAFRRASAVVRMTDLICTRDPSDSGSFCVLRTRLFTRLAAEEADVGAPVIAPNPNASPSAADEDVVRAPRAVSDASDGRRGAAETDDSDPRDGLAVVLNPLSRPGFACSFCGRTVLAALLDLADVFNVPLPGGDRALTVARARALLLDGCGVVDGPSGGGQSSSCLQLFATSTPASAHFDAARGLAVQGLADHCAGAFAAGFAAGTCSDSCGYAIAIAQSAFSCCFPSQLALTMAAGDLVAVPAGLDAAALLRAAASSCPSAVVRPSTACRAGLQRFVAARFPALRPSWVEARRAAFAAALARDLARATGHAASAFTLESLISPDDGSTVAVVGILTPSNASSVDVTAATRALLGGDDASFPFLTALVQSDPAVAAGGATAVVAVQAVDASALYAPAPRPPTDVVTSGGEGRGRGAGPLPLLAAAAAVVAAAVVAAAGAWA